MVSRVGEGKRSGGRMMVFTVPRVAFLGGCYVNFSSPELRVIRDLEEFLNRV